MTETRGKPTASSRWAAAESVSASHGCGNRSRKKGMQKKASTPASQAGPSPTKKGSGRAAASASERSRLVLWTRSGGRCQYRGCNAELLGDIVSGTRALNRAYIAHIVAAAPHGPRGDPVRSPLLADDVANLMLLCDAHHRLIDRDKVNEHPECFLLEMKREHESRVANVLAVNPVQASHALRYAARIGALESPVAVETVFREMLPDVHPAGWRTIDIELVGSHLTDDRSEYWSLQRDNLRQSFKDQVSGRIERQDIRHLSVFALAPIPLLIELGRLLGDKVPVSIRQLHRNPKSWRWQEDRAPIRFRTTAPGQSSDRVVALKLSISATIIDERIRAVLGQEVPIWSVEANDPHNDIMRSLRDLAEFGNLIHRTLDAIKSAHGEDAELHVFPAIPVSAAVELGRRWMPKADLPMTIWDQNTTAGGFMRTIDIRSD